MTDIKRRLNSAKDSIIRQATDSNARDALEREAAIANKTYSLFNTTSKGSKLSKDSKGEATNDRVSGKDRASAKPATEEDTYNSR